MWLESKGSWVWNLDKTSLLFFLLLPSFIHSSLPSHRKTHSKLLKWRSSSPCFIILNLWLYEEWEKCQFIYNFFAFFFLRHLLNAFVYFMLEISTFDPNKEFIPFLEFFRWCSFWRSIQKCSFYEKSMLKPHKSIQMVCPIFHYAHQIMNLLKSYAQTFWHVCKSALLQMTQHSWQLSNGADECYGLAVSMRT